MLRLLHFSDIHFNKEQGVNDDNIEVRDGIEKDLKYLMQEDATKIDYILVCGDIAFSGKQMEYTKASVWLNTIGNIVKCKASSILMVPGNHDIDRTIINNSFIQKVLHENIRNQSKDEVDRTFADLVENKQIDILKLPQSNYNDFASLYECNLINNQIYWELKHENFGEYQLKFRGCNSALLADKEDNDFSNKMALSKQQYYIKDDFKTIFITLCHHPIECLIDKEYVENSFNKKVALQFYGHNHQFHTERKERSLIIHAGAIKPDPAEDIYNPCYNIIDIDIKEEEGILVFDVRIWIREWNGSKFVSGVSTDALFEEYSIQLKDDSNPWTQKKKKVMKDDQSKEILQPINKLIETDSGMEEYTERDVRYIFLTLPFTDRRKIGNEMMQHSFDDSQKSEMARSLEFLNKIKEEKRYNELWEKLTN